MPAQPLQIFSDRSDRPSRIKTDRLQKYKISYLAEGHYTRKLYGLITLLPN